jgi:hypothetical protein
MSILFSDKNILHSAFIVITDFPAVMGAENIFTRVQIIHNGLCIGLMRAREHNHTVELLDCLQKLLRVRSDIDTKLFLAKKNITFNLSPLGKVLSTNACEYPNSRPLLQCTSVSSRSNSKSFFLPLGLGIMIFLLGLG